MCLRLAVVIGGWHYPLQPFETIPRIPLPVGWRADYFCIGHRDPDLKIVRSEKDVIESGCASLWRYDAELYAAFASKAEMGRLGWKFSLRENTYGDWAYLNQWMEEVDSRQYSAVWWLHDDTYMRPGAVSLLRDVLPMRVAAIGNGKYPSAPPCYLRGSFEFFSREALDLIGKFDLGGAEVTREGLIDTPAEFAALSDWNATAEPTRRLLARNRSRVDYLSPYYRISKYAIEGERGLISSTVGAPWSVFEGASQLLGVDAA